ncbi:hypothetical protein MNV49_005724 [Pseudohyphozyma bogoriensis]|nr:hypothetical protein MNV49_005724 [Pseudohyphozyma bogoriensis]
MATPTSRLLALTKLRTQIFGTTFNPANLRIGSKVLKARLRGPSMLQYYGPRLTGFASLNAQIPDLALVDPLEEQRLIDLETRRKRGKVTPKKGNSRDKADERQ